MSQCYPLGAFLKLYHRGRSFVPQVHIYMDTVEAQRVCTSKREKVGPFGLLTPDSLLGIF